MSARSKDAAAQDALSAYDAIGPVGERYVAYVSTYTRGHEYGIRIYDVDMEKGYFTEKEKVPITNSSYVTISHDKDRSFLYSITDSGVESYRIDPHTGHLEQLNKASINGMRGCYLSTDYDDRFLFVAGYHDGKVTSLRLKSDGSVGDIADEVYHHGMGSIADRNFRPHVSCVKMTRDNKYLLVAESGMDHVNVYSLDHKKGTLKLIDVIRCDLESSPHRVKFSRDGRFLYIVHELKNTIDVYTYQDMGKLPSFERIQTISTLRDDSMGTCAACAINFSRDGRFLLSSNAGDDSVVMYRLDKEKGLLDTVLNLPISGDYPKDVLFFPDGRHIVSLNHESNSLTFFRVHPDEGYIAMVGREIPVDRPNCLIFKRLV